MKWRTKWNVGGWWWMVVGQSVTSAATAAWAAGAVAGAAASQPCLLVPLLLWLDWGLGRCVVARRGVVVWSVGRGVRSLRESRRMVPQEENEELSRRGALERWSEWTKEVDKAEFRRLTEVSSHVCGYTVI